VQCGFSARPHRRGMCRGCYEAYRSSPHFEPRKREGRVRLRAGVRERWCWDHRDWLGESDFRTRMRRGQVLFETICKECSAKRAKAKYADERQRLLLRSRNRYEAVRDETRRADAARARLPAVGVPASLVAEWLSDHVAGGATLKAIAREVRANHSTLLRVVEGSRSHVPFALAERIAIASSRIRDFDALIPIGSAGWSKHAAHCRHCGRFDRPHWAQGFCLRCYSMNRYWARRGEETPPPRNERWALAAPMGCKRCGTRTSPHQARGLCACCYRTIVSQANRIGVPVGTLLDELGYARRIVSRATRPISDPSASRKVGEGARSPRPEGRAPS
jgi:hypothetical protein